MLEEVETHEGLVLTVYYRNKSLPREAEEFLGGDERLLKVIFLPGFVCGQTGRVDGANGERSPSSMMFTDYVVNWL